ESGAPDTDRSCRRLYLVGRRTRPAADPAETALGRVDRQILYGVAAVENELVDDHRRVTPDGELGAITKHKLAKARTRGSNSLIAMNRRLGGERPAIAGHRCLDEDRFADLF